MLVSSMVTPEEGGGELGGGREALEVAGDDVAEDEEVDGQDPDAGLPLRFFTGRAGAGGLGDGQGQGADRGGLVHDHQDDAELRRQLVEDGPQFRLAVGQMPPLAGPRRT